jgi:hypothetical protein
LDEPHGVENEREMYHRLAEGEGDGLDPEVKAALAERDSASQRTASERNQVYSEIEARNAVDHARLARELEEEKQL